jgi:hypothetical protein
VTYFISNGYGDSEDEPTVAVMRRFLHELDPSDEEHGAAWVTDDLGRLLEWNVGGRLVFDNRSRDPRHMLNVSIERVVELWQLLVQGRILEVESEPWSLGSAPPLSSEERERRDREQAALRRAGDLEFFEALGPERDCPPCRGHGCNRGAIHHSAFCRRHHFEMIRGYVCPFDAGSA